jgi:hypothetical protein
MTTFELTWQESRNNAYVPSSSTDLGQYIAWFLSRALIAGTGITYKDYANASIGSPAGGWTVQGSSDGTTGALDAVDRWTTSYTPAKIVYAAANGSAHSWIVLKSPWNLYVLISCYGSTGGHLIHIGASLTAYSGGSNTTDPTTSNEFLIASGAVQKNTNSQSNTHLHAWLATNGEFMFASSRDGSGFVNWMLQFRQLTETHAGDSHNAWLYHEFDDSSGVGRHSGTTGTMNTSAAASPGSGWQGRSATPATAAVCAAAASLSMAGGATSVLGDMPAADPIDSKEQDFAMRLYVTTASHKSVRGRLQDVCWSPPAAGSNKVEPSGGGPYASVLIGNLWFPWHDTVNALSL